MRLTLCLNCLESGAVAVQIGHEYGSQRDPSWDSVDLCPICKQALKAGDFETIAKRYTKERTISVGAQRGR